MYLIFMVTFLVTACSGRAFSEDWKNRWAAKANSSVHFTPWDLFSPSAPQMDFLALFFVFSFSTFLRHYLCIYSHGTSPGSINITVHPKSIWSTFGSSKEWCYRRQCTHFLGSLQLRAPALFKASFESCSKAFLKFCPKSKGSVYRFYCSLQD